jgi:hypothetical protein
MDAAGVLLLQSSIANAGNRMLFLLPSSFQ